MKTKFLLVIIFLSSGIFAQETPEKKVYHYDALSLSAGANISLIHDDYYTKQVPGVGGFLGFGYVPYQNDKFSVTSTLIYSYHQAFNELHSNNFNYQLNNKIHSLQIGGYMTFLRQKTFQPNAGFLAGFTLGNAYTFKIFENSDLIYKDTSVRDDKFRSNIYFQGGFQIQLKPDIFLDINAFVPLIRESDKEFMTFFNLGVKYVWDM